MDFIIKNLLGNTTSTNEIFKNLIPKELDTQWWYFVVVSFSVLPFGYLSKKLLAL
jgi:hypothetical protein